jgi:hypothetical protein
MRSQKVAWIVRMGLEVFVSAYHCITLKTRRSVSSSPKRMSVTKVIINNIPLNRTDGRREGNIGMYAARGSVTARGRCGGGRSMGLLVASV